MATSNSSDFNQTLNEIIIDALVLVGAIEQGETPSDDDWQSTKRQLNRMVKSWNAEGFHLWKTVEGVLHVVADQAQYDIGPAGKAALESDAVKTELGADASSGASSITVDSITGIADGDNIGIELDDGTLQWTTVNGAPAGTTVTLTATLIGAAGTDNHVYAYTSAIDRPLRVTAARRRDEAGTDVPVFMFSRQEYFDTPNKTNSGATTQVYYDPQLTNGQMYLWPTPSSVKDRIFFTAHIPLEDFDEAGDNPDFPQEWLDCLVWGLAYRMSMSFGTPMQTREALRRDALEMKIKVLGFDREPGSVYFGVGRY